MTRKVYLIPGFGHHHNNKIYRNVKNYFRDAGVICKPLSIKWKYHSIFSYVEQVLKVYRNSSNSEVYLFGFSFGALIALLVSIYVNPRRLYLCSLSPLFAEDIMKDNLQANASLGTRRTKILRQIHLTEIAGAVQCRTVIVVGGSELPSVINCARKTKTGIKNSKLYVAAEATHNLLDETYDQILQRVIK